MLWTDVRAAHAQVQCCSQPGSGSCCVQVTSQYRGLARQAMVYEQGRFEAWRAGIDSTVLSLLRQAPLVAGPTGR